MTRREETERFINLLIDMAASLRPDADPKKIADLKAYMAKRIPEEEDGPVEL